MSKKTKVITLGCRLNAYESEVMLGHAKDSGLENSVIINTCAVTREAVRSSHHAIRKAKKENPECNIIVTGCAAQIDPGAFSKMSEVDVVIGNNEKMVATNFEPDKLLFGEPIKVNDIMSVKELAPQLIPGGNRNLTKTQSRTRAFLQVQNGCDHRCTFCIIPYGRGNARSTPAGSVVSHVQSLVLQGYKEVVLTGVDLSSWGQDLPGKPPLGDLIKRILKLVPSLQRLRLSSIDPAEIDSELFTALSSDKRMTPYLHLSLQSGDNMILKRMKRRHSREEVISLCKKLKLLRPEFTFGADIIAGFPTENDEMFENSKSIVKEIGIPWLHVFPYSAHEGTPAEKMPQLESSVIKLRAKILREEGEHVKLMHLKSRVGTKDFALFEETGYGRLPDFTLVKVDNPPKAGNIAKVHITGIDSNKVIGKLI